MAVLTQTYKPNVKYMTSIWKIEEFVDRLKPRRCMVVSVGLIIIGLSIPAMVTIELYPYTLLLGFLSFILIGAGVILTLFYCGEI